MNENQTDSGFKFSFGGTQNNPLKGKRISNKILKTEDCFSQTQELEPLANYYSTDKALSTYNPTDR